MEGLSALHGLGVLLKKVRFVANRFLSAIRDNEPAIIISLNRAAPNGSALQFPLEFAQVIRSDVTPVIELRGIPKLHGILPATRRTRLDRQPLPALS